MVTITFGELYEVQSKFRWRGIINFYRGNLEFFSTIEADLVIAKQLQQKFPEFFEAFNFYSELGKNKVRFTTVTNTSFYISND